MEAKHYGCWVLGCLGAIFVEHSLIVGSHALHSVIGSDRGYVDRFAAGLTVGGVGDIGKDDTLIAGVDLSAYNTYLGFLVADRAKCFY